MPKPKIDEVYAVWGSRLNCSILTREKIPVRVLSRTDWIMPKFGRDLQPHQAVPAARFTGASTYGQGYAFPQGLLICWLQEPRLPGDTGWQAATGPDAVRRLRALARPNLRSYRDFLYGAAKEHNLQLDVACTADLTDLITEEN